MEKRSVLYMLDPMQHNSPFDINMAVDADYDLILPYNQVGLEAINGMAQDMIFSRGPEGAQKTGLFIGGRDIGLAMDMLEAAQKAMVPPFQISVMADPSGAFTTAAALVAMVERQLGEKHGGIGLAGLNTIVFGGTGPVGIATGVLAALHGAQTTIADHASLDRALEIANTYGARFGVALDGTCAASEADKAHLLQRADVVFCTAKAGIQVLKASVLAEAQQLKVAADVNAVPPLGIEGVKRTDCGTPLKHAARSLGAVGIGSLAVGDVKYKLQHRLLRSLLRHDEPVFVDFRQAYEEACGMLRL